MFWESNKKDSKNKRNFFIKKRFTKCKRRFLYKRKKWVRLTFLKKKKIPRKKKKRDELKFEEYKEVQVKKFKRNFNDKYFKMKNNQRWIFNWYNIVLLKFNEEFDVNQGVFIPIRKDIGFAFFIKNRQTR